MECSMHVSEEQQLIATGRQGQDAGAVTAVKHT